MESQNDGVRNHVADESTGLRGWCRRNPATAGAGGAAIVMLAIVAAICSVLMYRVSEAERMLGKAGAAQQVAEKELDQANKIIEAEHQRSIDALRTSQETLEQFITAMQDSELTKDARLDTLRQRLRKESREQFDRAGGE